MKVGVIGGGAAGMIAAYFSAINGNDVVLIEKNEKLGKKIYITGKGRCNLTNLCEPDDFLQNVVTNPKFVYASIYGFTPQETVDFFNGLGLKTKVERGNRVFPESDKSSDVIKTLSSAILSAKVTVKLNETVKSITTFGGAVKSIITDKNKYFCDRVIVATGGLSYPSTGSTGDGYGFAEAVGHTVTELSPSLTGLNLAGGDFSPLQGLTLKNVGVSVFADGKLIYAKQGEALFTHYGISGPTILSASSVINGVKADKFMLKIDLKPALERETLSARVLRDFNLNLNKEIKNSLDALLPKSLIPLIIKRAGIPEYKKPNSITVKERERLVFALKNLDFEITGTRGFNEAVITRGGVCVKEINPKNMESKLIKGLRFCGEVLDLDAFTGGFNLQIAFSTGKAAAND